MSATTPCTAGHAAATCTPATSRTLVDRPVAAAAAGARLTNSVRGDVSERRAAALCGLSPQRQRPESGVRSARACAAGSFYLAAAVPRRRRWRRRREPPTAARGRQRGWFVAPAPRSAATRTAVAVRAPARTHDPRASPAAAGRRGSGDGRQRRGCRKKHVGGRRCSTAPVWWPPPRPTLRACGVCLSHDHALPGGPTRDLPQRPLWCGGFCKKALTIL